MGVQIPPGLPFLSLPAGERAWLLRALERDGAMEFSIKEKFEAAKQFLREVKTELKKVTWPSRKDTLSGTLVVLVAVFIIAIFLGIVDSGLSSLVKQLLKRAAS
jgi:preprotein translocase subunit SecE